MKKFSIKFNFINWEIVPFKKRQSSIITEYYFLFLLITITKTLKEYSKNRNCDIVFDLKHSHGKKTYHAKLTESEVSKIIDIIELTQK